MYNRKKLLKYRYVCPACTGIAFYSEDKKPRGLVRCDSCLMEIKADRPENFIPLTGERMKIVNFLANKKK